MVHRDPPVTAHESRSAEWNYIRDFENLERPTRRFFQSRRIRVGYGNVVVPGRRWNVRSARVAEECDELRTRDSTRRLADPEKRSVQIQSAARSLPPSRVFLCDH